MVEIIFDEIFKSDISKIKDSSLKERVDKQITKIIENPEIGKPMRNVRKGTREVYIKPFRLSYKYHQDKEIIEFLEFYHKKKQ